MPPYPWTSPVSNGLFFFFCFAFRVIAQPFAIDTLQWTGPPDQRINVVFFGDGYQEAEFDKYAADVKSVADHFFGQAPFEEYRSYFNIIAFQVPSNESGASHDPE
ncbi:MAG: M64 family metallopeptidase, partial [Saprospiraceae bacterium]|nr:M64 family metallopeptidase [Saprospiraceae bacterium]